MKNLCLICLLFPVTTLAELVESTPTNRINADCVTAIKQCLMESKDKKDNCLSNASDNNACSDTLLGKIVLKRSIFSAATSPDEIPAPAITGPVLVDKECLTNFDNKFSSIMLKGSINSEEVLSLEDLLTECEKDTEIEENMLEKLKP